MRHPPRLLGQDAVIDTARELLGEGRSVLLFGPEAIGKSAIIAVLMRDGLLVIDPFERVSSQRAYELRRAMDHGAVVMAAARAPRGRQLGSVGRILWRFSLVRVRELPDPVLYRIVKREAGLVGGEADGWIREIVSLSQGRPGFATAMGRFAKQWKSAHGYLPLAALAFAATRQDTVIRSLQESKLRSRSSLKSVPRRNARL